MRLRGEHIKRHNSGSRWLVFIKPIYKFAFTIFSSDWARSREGEKKTTTRQLLFRRLEISTLRSPQGTTNKPVAAESRGPLIRSTDIFWDSIRTDFNTLFRAAAIRRAASVDNSWIRSRRNPSVKRSKSPLLRLSDLPFKYFPFFLTMEHRRSGRSGQR